MLNFKKQFVFLIAITAIFAGSFGFIDNVEAEYVSTSTITSADLISESNVSSIDSFYYNATSIPSGTSLEFQFATSSNSGPWYDSSGSSGGWDTVSTTGGDTIDLSSLNWSANSFYYKMRMTSDGTSTPVLDNIKVNYTIDYSGLFTMDKTSGYIGIGTTSPSSLFTVGSSGNFQVNDTGQVTSGTWQGDLISSTYGGTGWDSSAVTGIPIINSGTWSSTSTINDSYISDTLTLSTSSSVAKGALTNTGTLSFDWVDSEVADNLTINTSGSVQAEAIDQEGASTGQVLEWNGTSWQPATDDDTTYSAGDYLTLSGTTFNVTDSWWDSVSDVPTATPSDGDTTHLSTADHIYDFVTGQGYITDYQDLGYVNSNAPTGNYATHTVTISNGTNAIIYDYYDPDTNTTYSAGNDLDLSGTTFNIESTLDFVSTINLDGTGSITGLDSIDATTENTLESALDHDDLTGFVTNEHIDHSSVSISGGTGLTGGGDITSPRTLSHADTSSQASSDNSGNTFIQDISLDDYGHLTGLTTGSVSSLDDYQSWTAQDDDVLHMGLLQ